MCIVRRMILFALVFALLLCGCGDKGSCDVSGYAPREAERLTVFACLDEGLCETLVQEFQERTGIWVSLERGSAPELLARIAAEPGCCDLLLGCGVDTLRASNFPGGDIAALSYRTPVIVYNPRLIRQNPPVGFSDLLNSDWQGKIAFADPAGSDFSRSLLCALVCLFPEKAPEDLFGALRGNLTDLLTDPQALADRISDGTYCLGMVPEETALAAIADGAELTVVYPQEGTFLIPDCAAIPESAVHRENAQAFVDFLLSPDAQRHARDYANRRSVLPELAQIPEKELLYDTGEAAAMQPSLLELWNGEGMP